MNGAQKSNKNTKYFTLLYFIVFYSQFAITHCLTTRYELVAIDMRNENVKHSVDFQFCFFFLLFSNEQNVVAFEYVCILSRRAKWKIITIKIHYSECININTGTHAQCTMQSTEEFEGDNDNDHKTLPKFSRRLGCSSEQRILCFVFCNLYRIAYIVLNVSKWIYGIKYMQSRRYVDCYRM